LGLGVFVAHELFGLVVFMKQGFAGSGKKEKELDSKGMIWYYTIQEFLRNSEMLS